MRFVRLHGIRSRDNFFPAELKIEAFLTDLAVPGNVAALPPRRKPGNTCLDVPL